MKLITAIIRPDALFGFFLKYYTRQGVTEFYVITESTERPALPYTLHWVQRPNVWDWQNNEALFNQLRQEHVRPDEFFVIADADEFHRTPFPDFHALVASLKAEGADFQGHGMLDRVAADGSIPEIVADRPLDEQFPVGALFTQHVLFATHGKASVARGDRVILLGHHDTAGRAAKTQHWTHHFKWHGNVLAELEKRSVTQANCRLANGNYAEECAVAVEHFRRNRGRMDLSKIPLVKPNPLYV